MLKQQEGENRTGTTQTPGEAKDYTRVQYHNTQPLPEHGAAERPTGVQPGGNTGGFALGQPETAAIYLLFATVFRFLLALRGMSATLLLVPWNLSHSQRDC